MLKRKSKYIPFGYKLLLSYLLLVLTPVITIGYYAYHTSVDALRENTSERVRGTLVQMKDNIGYQVQDLEQVASQIYYNYTMQDYFRRYEEGWYSYEATRDFIMPTLSNTLNYTNHNILLALYLHNNTFPEIYYSDTIENPLDRSSRYEIHHLNQTDDRSWLYQLEYPEQSFERKVWQQVGTDFRHDNISLLWKLYDIKQGGEIGVLRVSIRLEDLLQALDYRLIDEGGSIQIFDIKGQLMAASQGELVDNLDDRALILHETIPNLNWTMEAVIPSSMFDAGADKVRRLTILLCLLSTVVLLVIGVLFSSYFAKRISKIIRLIYSYREGDFHKRIAYDGNDEFGQIAVAFNEMGQNLDEMIRENYIANLRKKEAELEVLQAQINPHFLYNTLSSISRLGKLGKIDQMHEMVLALARFYRLSLNEGKIETTIEKELEHIRAYIGIQSIKYGSRLTVLYDIDSETFPYRTIRIILQPFVENILEHAWDGNQIAMKLIVRKVNNGIEFRIVDNGIGMKPSLVNGLLDPLAGKGYGIRNVDSRIKLHYSEPYGVAIKSRLGTGTSVRITIPMLEMHE